MAIRVGSTPRWGLLAAPLRGFREGRIDTAIESSLAITVAVGAAVALASAIPLTFRAGILAFLLVTWCAVILLACSTMVARALRRQHQRIDGWFAAAGVLGVLVACFAVLQLELIRVFAGRPDLTWNRDWRFALTQAHAVALSGGLDQSIAYSGTPIQYHVGPAWLAGVAGRLIDGATEHVIFGLVPLLSTLAVAVALFAILRLFMGGSGAVAAAVGVAFALPGLNGAMPLTAPGFVVYAQTELADPAQWMFTAFNMLNALFALAVGLSGAALLLSRDAGWVRIALGAVGLGAVAALKPQFFAGLGLVTGLVSVSGALGVMGDQRRWYRALLGCLAALVGAVLLLGIVPRMPGIFAQPTFSPGETGITIGMLTREPLRVSSILAMAALAAVVVRTRAGAAKVATPQPLVVLLVCSALAVGALVLVLFVVAFPVRSEYVRAAAEMGYHYGAAGEQYNLAQSLVPSRFIMAATGVAVLLFAARSASRRWQRAAVGVCILLALAPLGFMARGFLAPASVNEAVEDRDLRRVLAAVPVEGSILLSSDIADPAENYHSAHLALHLPATAGHTFYLSNVRFVNWLLPDAVERVRLARVFFGSEWSEWHIQFLAAAGITHVLLHDRCPPNWAADAAGSPSVLKSVGSWTVLEVPPLEMRAKAVPEPEWSDLIPRYGSAPCLRGETPR